VYLVDAVTELLAEVVADEVLPRFRRLRASDVTAKATPGDPHDIVTVVDRVVERRLERALTALLPGSVVVGEEAVHADPRRLGALLGPDPVWLVDPLDGTKNFARGDDTFGVMIAFAQSGVTQAAWISLPARGETFVAVKEAGTYAGGRRVQVPATSKATREPDGTCYTGFMHNDLAEFVQRRLPGACKGGVGAAAIEYTGVARGEKDFVLYHRLLPWDHAPGALVLTEAGGRVEFLDGAPYEMGAPDQIMIVGRTPQNCAVVRDRLGQS
jgi:fructose-1,6-bisphosphatase/inositol monophosphatase family enzyme